MDDLQFGTRDKRGDFAPAQALEIAPIFLWPPRPEKYVKWLRGYFAPWNIGFMALAAIYWFFLTPGAETLKTLSFGWIAYLLARNMALVALFYGGLELRLYAKRSQGTAFKYNAKWPAESPGGAFMFKSQNADNAIRTFATGLPIWTAYEALGLWSYANGHGAWTTFAAHPIWLACFGLVIPLVHQLHFYCVHRLIHTPTLYRHVHSVHHNSVNASPWSSLSMHPAEHLLYWSGSLIHLMLPSHPLLLLYHLHVTGTGAVVGHIGFDKLVVGDGAAVDSHAYAHYLHHKYFEVNYGDGAVPLDMVFGTWHDGSKAAQARMEARHEAKVARVNARL